MTVDSSRPTGPVTIRIDEWLFGRPEAPPDAVAIPGEGQAPPSPGMSDGRLAAAWAGTQIADRVPVTAIRVLQDGAAGRQGDPVRVTSDQREAAAIRSVAENASRLEADPSLVSEFVSSLSRSPDPALAGYLVMHLWMHAPVPPQPVLATELLLQMLPNPSVPGADMEFIAQVVVFHYNGLPAAVKSEVVQHFVDLGQRQDVWSARAGYAGLAKIAAFDREAVGTIRPEALTALGNIYRELVKTGSIKRNGSLEAGLGIKVQ